MNKLDKSIKYAKRAIHLAKSYKKDKNQKPNNYILLFGVDIWNTIGQRGAPRIVNYDHQPRYFVLTRDYSIKIPNHKFYMISNPTYSELLSDKEYHFTKSFLKERLFKYNVFMNAFIRGSKPWHDSPNACAPKVLSLSQFKSTFGSK